jgi:dCMP deaminase
VRPSIDDYFMTMARLAGSRSTCVRRSVGCVLVSARNHVLATGYNGVPAGEEHCNDIVVAKRRIGFPNACIGSGAQSGQNIDACLAVHAEQNAILQCRDAYLIDRAYVTAFPCPSCAKLLLNTSCLTVVYATAYGDDAGREMWLRAGRVAQLSGGAPHMIQADLVELFSNDDLSPWRVTVACACMNLSAARMARGVVFRLLERWPDPMALGSAGADLEAMLLPLGLSQRRARALRSVSTVCLQDGRPTEAAFGVGRYALESVRVFCDGWLPYPDDIGDRKVAAWVQWRLENAMSPGRDSR